MIKKNLSRKNARLQFRNVFPDCVQCHAEIPKEPLGRGGSLKRLYRLQPTLKFQQNLFKKKIKIKNNFKEKNPKKLKLTAVFLFLKIFNLKYTSATLG